MESTVAYIKIAAYLGAAFMMAVGILGPTLAQGKVGATACENLGKYPESAKDIRGAMILALGIIEASSLYLLLIAGALIYVANSVI